MKLKFTEIKVCYDLHEIEFDHFLASLCAILSILRRPLECSKAALLSALPAVDATARRVTTAR